MPSARLSQCACSRTHLTVGMWLLERMLRRVATGPRGRGVEVWAVDLQAAGSMRAAKGPCNQSDGITQRIHAFATCSCVPVCWQPRNKKQMQHATCMCRSCPDSRSRCRMPPPIPGPIARAHRARGLWFAILVRIRDVLEGSPLLALCLVHHLCQSNRRASAGLTTTLQTSRCYLWAGGAGGCDQQAGLQKWRQRAPGLPAPPPALTRACRCPACPQRRAEREPGPPAASLLKRGFNRQEAAQPVGRCVPEEAVRGVERVWGG